MTKMAKLTSLKNIEQKLKSVGISTAEELKATGSKAAFAKLKRKYPTEKSMCLVHLYALEGAITDTDYNQLPEKTKEDLKHYNNSLKIFGID